MKNNYIIEYKQIFNMEHLACSKDANTVFAGSSPLYATGVSLGPPETLTQTAS